jgi:iron complex transport system ATP-binding protein
MFPTSGKVRLLGEQLGMTDMAELTPLIGWASSAMMGDIPPAERVGDVVLTGAYSVSGRWREQYESADVIRAASLMYTWGLSHLAQRTFGTLSEGERKRTCIARALMSNPELLLLDEPGAGLDLGGREDLITRMSQLAQGMDEPTQILVTHHVEEIPAGFTHALLMRDGKIVTQGVINDVITGPWLTATFGLPIKVSRVGERFLAMRDE